MTSGKLGFWPTYPTQIFKIHYLLDDFPNELSIVYANIEMT